MKQTIFSSIRKSAVVIILTLFTYSAVVAQNLKSGYFDQNYTYRFQLNPAFGSDRGFVGIPGIGNLNVGIEGNIGVSHFIYNINGQTTTFLNPDVPAQKFLNGLHDKMRLGEDVKATVLAVGFKGLGGYNTISVNVRENMNLCFPKALMQLAKQGVENDSYNIGLTGAEGNAWLDISLNHSHNINDRLRIGAAFKFILGVASLNANFKKADITLGTDNWSGCVDADLTLRMKNASFKHDYNERTKRQYVNGLEIKSFSPFNGFGVAFDLGAVYTLNKNWEFSASLLDLGFINWQNSLLATTNGLQQISTNDYTFDVKDNDATFDKLKDDVSMLYQLNDAGDTGSKLSGLGATLNIGAQYSLPVYRKLRFGFLNTTRINGRFSSTDFRLSANIQPKRCFSAGANIGMGTFGFSFGWILDVKCPGFNIWLASDRTPGKLAKQGIPLNSNLNLNLGLNIPF